MKKKTTKRAMFVPKFKAGDKVQYRGKTWKVTHSVGYQAWSDHLYYNIKCGKTETQVRSDGLTPACCGM